MVASSKIEFCPEMRFCDNVTKTHSTRRELCTFTKFCCLHYWNPHAVKAGVEVLAAGGTAADAAVAVQMMLNLVEPQSSGIGGGAFMLYWDAKAKNLLTFDGREKAPATATPAYFQNSEGESMKWQDAMVGGRSVGVPGTLKLLEHVHAKLGTQDWADLLNPAIAKAREGFKVSPRLAKSIVHIFLQR